MSAEALNEMLLLIRDHSVALEKYLAEALKDFLVHQNEAYRALYRIPYDASVGTIAREAGFSAYLERWTEKKIAEFLATQCNFTDREALESLMFASVAHDYFLAFSARAARGFFPA